MPLVVAFDLDMTLIDTVPGVAGTLTALGGELGVDLPVAELTARLGPPLDVLLDGHLPAEVMASAVDRFRELYVDHAIHTVTTLDGAVESIAAVRRHGGRVVVVTGKYEPNARRHVEHLALDVDHVTGLVVGAGKAEALLREGASLLVGDHVHDVEGARAAPTSCSPTSPPFPPGSTRSSRPRSPSGSDRPLPVGARWRGPPRLSVPAPAAPRAARRGRDVPTGKVKWFDAEKGFGFLSQEDGPDVYVRSDALPEGTPALKPGTRVEFGIAQGRRGDQALQVRVIDAPVSVARNQRQAQKKRPDEMVAIVEDLIRLLDGVGEAYRHDRHPDRRTSAPVAKLLRALADELEA